MYDPIAQLRDIPQPWKTISIGYKGWWTKVARRALAAQGFGPAHALEPINPVSDNFDQGLYLLTKAFQTTMKMTPDGVIGPKTWAMIAVISAIADPPGAYDETRARIAVVDYAKKMLQLNIRETSPNRGPMVDEIQRHANGKRGYAWCIALVDYDVENAFDALGYNTPMDIGTSSGDLVRRAKKLGRFKDYTKAKPGDIMLLRGGPTGWKHGGLVILPHGNGIITTIEGNTNIFGSPEGDGVYEKTREYKRTKYDLVDICTP
jgi:hypothetical protein